MRLTIKDVIRLQKKSGSKARGRSFDSPDARCRLNSGFWASRRNKPQLGVYAACLYSRIGRNLDHFIAQKSKPRNGAREIFMTATAQRVSLVVSAVNTAAVGGRKAA
jgi:hypothetical protein